MATIGYARVSTDEQNTAAQQHQIEQERRIDRWFTDQATSGTVKALERPDFARLHDYVRDGDTVIVAAIDRLGRDTVDVLQTVETLKAKGVKIVSIREGFDLNTHMGEAMLTMLSAMAKLEWSNIKARQMAGIEQARAEGRNLGRPHAADPVEIAQWRQDNDASQAETAEHFGVSLSTVKRATRDAKAA